MVLELLLEIRNVRNLPSKEPETYTVPNRKAMHYIYALVDPRYSKTRYIGATASKYRLNEHIAAARRRHSPVNLWVRELLESGHRPVQIILQVVTTVQDRHVAERHWIGHFLALGAVLLNVSIGGPSTIKRVHMLRKKLSATELSQKRSLAAFKAHAKRRARALREGWDKY